MTLKEYIQNYGNKLYTQLQEQKLMKMSLYSQLQDLEKKAKQGESVGSDIKLLKEKIAAVEGLYKRMEKMIQHVYSCAERVDKFLVKTKSDKIKGDRGNIISEAVYELGNDMSYTERKTTVDGIGYEFVSLAFKRMISFDPKTNRKDEHTISIKEGYEDGERTFYEQEGAWDYERIEKVLAYDDVISTTSLGNKIHTKKRKPANDIEYHTTRDVDGTKNTIDRLIIDKNGHTIGVFKLSEQRNGYFDKNPFYRSATISRKFKGKDGNDFFFSSEIQDFFTEKRGLIRRDDFLNNQRLAQVMLFGADHFATIENYRDGTLTSWARYNKLDDGEWDLDREMYYKSGTDGLDVADPDYEEIIFEAHDNGEFVYHPRKMNFDEGYEGFKSQKEFLDGGYMPEELRSLLLSETFCSEATGLNWIGVVDLLGDDSIRRIRENPNVINRTEQPDWGQLS